MDNQISEAFDAIRASDQLKRKTKAALRKKTFDYGRNVYRIRQRHRRLAAGLMSLVLVLSGMGLWFAPSASISVDINPSIELKVNALDRVISLEGMNSDGIEVVKGLDVTGMEYADAMQRILLSGAMAPYLEKQSDINITVAGGISEEHASEILSDVLCRAYNIAGRDNVLYCKVGWETVRDARKVGLCIPRYLAWQSLLKWDPTVTVEDVRELSKERVRALAQTIVITDPCHE